MSVPSVLKCTQFTYGKSAVYGILEKFELDIREGNGGGPEKIIN